MECGGQPWVWVDAGVVTTVENTSEEGNSDLSFGRKFKFSAGPSRGNVRYNQIIGLELKGEVGGGDTLYREFKKQLFPREYSETANGPGIPSVALSLLPPSSSPHLLLHPSSHALAFASAHRNLVEAFPHRQEELPHTWKSYQPWLTNCQLLVQPGWWEVQLGGPSCNQARLRTPFLPLFYEGLTELTVIPSCGVTAWCSIHREMRLSPRAPLHLGKSHTCGVSITLT